MKILKRNNTVEEFDINKIYNAIVKAYKSCNTIPDDAILKGICSKVEYYLDNSLSPNSSAVTVEKIQDIVERALVEINFDVAKAYIIYREKHKNIREQALSKMNFINNFVKT